MTGTASVTFSGSVEMVAKSEIPNTPETAQIAVEGVNQESNIITIENTLTDSSAHEVHLNPGDKVEVTVDAKGDAIQPKGRKSGEG
jgi:protein involved in polysaccharide export with SLBB domain